MRRLASWSLALFGLALAAPSTVWAQDPGTDGGAVKPPVRRSKLLGHKHLCPDCQMKEQMRRDGLTTAPPTVVRGANGSCVACQGGPAMMGGPPGYASVGGGEMMLSAEPAPVGVVQASYRPMVPQAAPGYAVVGQGRLGMPSMASVPPASDPIAPPPRHKASIIAHLLGLPTSSAYLDARYEAKRSAHAAIRYGEPNRQVQELPASMVYGR